MISLLRKIRKQLINQGHMGKYFKYAIGEIILVMIGILLALQVSNWNQNRIAKNEERETVKKLQLDFVENKKILDRYLVDMRAEMNAHIVLMDLIGASKDELTRHNLDSLLHASLSASEFAFADNTIKNVMQSGKLNLLKDDQLTELLYQWNALSEIRNTRMAKLDDWINNHLLPYLLTKVSFKELDIYSNYRWTGKSKIKPDYYPLFQEIEFENNLDNSLWFHQQVRERCEETAVLIDSILKATERYD